MTEELTNPPFTRRKGEPPLHLRDWTPGEIEQYRRMIVTHEQLHKRQQETKNEQLS